MKIGYVFRSMKRILSFRVELHRTRFVAAEVMRFFEFSLVNAAFWGAFAATQSWILLACAAVTFVATSFYFFSYIPRISFEGENERMTAVLNRAIWLAAHLVLLGFQTVLVVIVFRLVSAAV